MVYKKVPEYLVEDNKRVNLKKLGYHKKGEMLYVKAREVIVRGCNDVFIEYNGGILLVIRQDKPAKGELWPIGGGIKRGVLLEDSIRKKVKEECGLELKDITFLGVSRHFWESSPKKGSKGADELSLAYFAKGKGTLNLDKMHKNPIIVTPKKYSKIRKDLHPWVRDFMDKAIIYVEKK